jgi:glycosyltransferase involved in cell wall biosynthesis
MVSTVRVLLVTVSKIVRADLFYLTIGQSPAAFSRDAVLVWTAWLFGKKVVARIDGGAFHELNSGPGWLRLYVRATIRRIHCVQVLSQVLRERFAMIPGLETRMEVVPDGAETPGNVAPKVLPSQGPLQVLYLSNLMFDKGYTYLIDAVSLLKQNNPEQDIRLHFAGDFIVDPDFFPSAQAAREDFNRRIQEAGLETVVTYHGVVSGAAKDALLRQCHVFALPTFYKYEGTPRSVREALSYATPVVATQWAGLPDMVEHGNNGLLVPPRDAGALAQALEEVLLAPEDYARMSKAALSRFQHEFSMEAYVGRVSATFNQVLAEKR